MLGLKAREQVVLGVRGLLIGFRFWCLARFLGSTLLPFLFSGPLIKTEY